MIFNSYLHRSYTLNRLLTLIFITLLNISCFASDTIIEVIPLMNRPASEILPLLNPLLDNSTQLIDNGSNILVKAAPYRMTEIKAIIKQLDIRQINLLITVIQSNQTNADELNAAAKARLDPANHTGQIIGHIYQTQDNYSDQNTQSIRTLEGIPAHIKIGNAYPIQNFSAYGYPTTTEFTEATTGFEVIPKLVGQQVILSVAPWSDKMNGRGQIATQNAQATIRMNLGTWVELGGVNENSNSTFANTLQIDKNQMHILIKVDQVD
jgi:type II secretory pathway component GspD/PulD (secretin)